jgi:hypothetical protein
VERTRKTFLSQRRLVTIAALAIAAWPTSATAQAAPGLGAERLYWYQFVDVGLAVSASILGFMFTFRVLGKVTLKSRELELQLREKAAVSDGGANQRPADVDGNARPVIDTQRGLFLVLRFVILDLTIRIWNVVPSAIGYLTNSLPHAVSAIMGDDALRDAQSASLPVAATWVLPSVISLGFSAVYWTMVLAFGWPLLKDTCSYLGIPLKGLFEPSSPR